MHHFSVLFLLYRNVGHRRRRPRTVPVFFSRRKPHHITGANLLNGPTFALRPPATRRDDQRLPERMRVPRRARTGFKCDACALHKRRIWRLK